MSDINTTKLSRRIAKYCSKYGGSIHQTGVNMFEKGAGVCNGTVRRMRNGSEIKTIQLQRMDAFLTREGF
jgi:hypothetical protein